MQQNKYDMKLCQIYFFCCEIQLFSLEMAPFIWLPRLALQYFIKSEQFSCNFSGVGGCISALLILVFKCLFVFDLLAKLFFLLSVP